MRSLIRYSAVTCIAAGGLFMGGTGAVALADTPGDGTSGVDTTPDGGNTRAPEPTAAPGGSGFPNWMRLPSFGATPEGSPRVGVIAPPIMNLPATLQSGTSPGGSTTRRAPTLTLPFVIGSPTTKPAGRQSAGTATVPDNSPPAGTVDTSPTGQDEGITTAQVDVTSTQQDDKPTATTTRGEPPTINLAPLVPRGVPMGPPLTINNPLRQLLASDVDWNAPVTQQLLPASLVALLNTVSEQFPLAGLLITPVMQFADAVIPLLLSDVVVATLPLGKMFPTPISTTQFTVGEPAQPLAGSMSPPAELAPMGMDVLQAPAPAQPLSSGLENPLAPPPSPDPGVAPLSDLVAYRAGYSDYLRNAGMAQITALAVPGAAAILLFSLGGGFIGYRQAKAGHVIRAEGITRFLR